MAVLRDDPAPVLEHVLVGATDEDLVAAIETAGRTGVDVPLGWPARFVDLVSAHATASLPAPASTGSDWRRSLAMRVTDRDVHRRTGLTPLSVSTDRIAYPALRWAGIEARLREQGTDVSRDGSGAVIEVYPAAALRCWSLPHRGYKETKNAGARLGLVTELEARTPWLDWNGHRDLCAADDNALDAVIAALITREASLGACEPPPEDLREIARQEGWIWLPSAPGPTAPSAPCC
ncbi:uncharacterized protein DUF429 [Bogoriella caseilytica]|uniref:Uncharacterized protein DUF429 n=1 Tax=Bogoriella caseilytica TaxID=56055 RepID=A0A3N2BA90_9MICO|nr:uncharacterized protein DUF429 [Bogoriella caseilytica]